VAARTHLDLVQAPAVRAARSVDLAAGLIDIRRLVRSVALRVMPARAGDAVLAAHEVAMNALTHGQGRGAVRVWAADDELVCEIEDHGPGIWDLLAGTRSPAPHQDRGRGLWIARQLSDRVEIETTPHGALVRLRWRLA
jgi:anti-sigma regulatory factor (Ser/Thr protein kinase)